MTMHADEDTGLDLVAPNRKVRMVRIDDLFRVDLRILRTIVRHGDDHDVRNLSSDFEHCLGLFNGMIVPGPEYQRSREDRGVGAGQHFPGHLFDDLVFIELQQPIVEPLPWVRQRDSQLSRRRRMESGGTWNNDAFSCTWHRRHSCTSLITHYNHWIGQDRDGGFLFIRDVVGYSGQRQLIDHDHLDRIVFRHIVTDPHTLRAALTPIHRHVCGAVLEAPVLPHVLAVLNGVRFRTILRAELATLRSTYLNIDIGDQIHGDSLVLNPG